MKKGLSYKDLLLLAGIVVAVIIALTTLVSNEQPSTANTLNPSPKKSSVMTLPAEVLRKMTERVSVKNY